MTEKIKYSKPPLSYQEQLEKLSQRDLLIHDNEQALTSLSNINYYRLSAYWIPFKQRDPFGKITDNFQKNTTLDNIIELYEFDRKLRLLVMDALERVEISIRTNITYHLAHQYGAFALENAGNFHDKFDHASWLAQVQQEITRSREPFIEHFKEKYNDFPKLPVWMATEITSFGSLSILYKGLKNEDKHNIAQKIYNLHPKTLTNWLHFLTYIRNICAHHSRLWNKELAIKPKVEGLSLEWHPPVTPRNDRLFFILLVIKNLLNHSENSQHWAQKCEELIVPILSKYNWSGNSMGIPQYWQKHPIWNHF